VGEERTLSRGDDESRWRGRLRGVVELAHRGPFPSESHVPLVLLNYRTDGEGDVE
jgi:hypothetical protein